MSGRNDDNSAMAVGLAIVATAFLLMAAFIFAIAAFAAVVFTVLALCAWDKPLTVFGQTLEPHEARAFVKRGLAGMVLLPVFAIFCVVLFKIQLIDEIWPYLFIGGYTLGSVGIEVLKAQAAEDAAMHAPYIPPAPPVALPQPEQPQRPSGQAQERFTYADWDDEEAQR